MSMLLVHAEANSEWRTGGSGADAKVVIVIGKVLYSTPSRSGCPNAVSLTYLNPDPYPQPHEWRKQAGNIMRIYRVLWVRIWSRVTPADRVAGGELARGGVVQPSAHENQPSACNHSLIGPVPAIRVPHR